MSETTLSERLSDTDRQDWRYPVGGGQEPLSRDEMLDMRRRLGSMLPEATLVEHEHVLRLGS